jgi:flagellar biosynthesis chaperone FliJ
MANWEGKSKYMLHEIIKYQNYCNALEDSITRQQEEASILSTETDGVTESLQSTSISKS